MQPHNLYVHLTFTLKKTSFLGLYSDSRLLSVIVKKKIQTHTYTQKEIVRVNNKKNGGQRYVA